MSTRASRSSTGKIVVDANVLFGALLRDSTNRNLMLHGQLDIHAPDWLWDELQRNRKLLLRKSRATETAFDLLIDCLQDRVRSIPYDAIEPHIAPALEELGPENRFDAPYVAAARAIDGGVWSHDKTLGNRASVPVFTTEHILQALGQPH